MDNLNILSVLKSVYSCSRLPAVIACNKTVWENSLFKKEFAFMSDSEKENLISSLLSKDGISYTMSGDTLYTVNVISSSDATIVEIMHSEPVKKMLSIPAIQEFLKYVFARLRQSVTVISVAADEIYAILSANTGCCECNASDTVAERLNAIDVSLVEIISAVIDPEQLFYLLDENCTDCTVCIKDELEKIAFDTKNIVNTDIAVETELENGIYARMNRSAFQVIITDMITKCCHSEYIPNKITISSYRTEDCGVEISVVSKADSGKIYEPKNFLNMPDGAGVFRRDMFFEYVCDFFCGRYGGSYTRQELKNGNSYTIRFPAIRPAQINVSSTAGFNSSDGHFGVVNVRLKDMNKVKRYDKINNRKKITVTVKE